MVANSQRTIIPVPETILSFRPRECRVCNYFLKYLQCELCTNVCMCHTHTHKEIFAA